ncbi:ABC transporter permease [Anaerosphaera multitolerans]|uniref:ABC transporter permease n=1 Tax=Anaerosphaera multitolerans TaxID=2487351 RepID=A0A437S851_9FIRM|nr:ABC transporter permease [Anaerosphaera multitolerans]RVU55253.1 ABC transporter permease [Anaerosphaera multitolerans]
MKFRKLAIPYLIWMIVFIVMPLVLVFFYSVTGGMIKDFNIENFTLENYRRFLTPQYLKVLFQSLKMALITTVFCLIIGYPTAYWIFSSKSKYKSVMLLLIVIPMWMNFLLRTYAWVLILSKNGILNNFLGIFGIEPLNLIYTNKAIMIGMVYNYLPFMILPIYSVFEKIDKSMIEAAQDLGATETQAFWKIIFPMSISGVITGITMVFIPAISTFEISALLGGNKYNLIGNIIENQYRLVGDWNFGSAMSIVMILLIIVAMMITNKFDSEDEKSGGGLL